MPCYNEESGLEKILRNKPAFIDEIIVVDNASTDKTAEVARRYGVVVIHEKNRGYGYAYQAGLPAASGDIVVTLDGDYSYPVSEIERLLTYMRINNLDFVVGCRYPLIDRSAQPVINKAANYAISWFIRVFFGINLIDSQSGMMAFRKDILDKLEAENTGMGFSQELKIRAFLLRGIKCGEAHISYLPRVGISKFQRMKNSMHNLYSVFSLWTELILAQKRSKP